MGYGLTRERHAVKHLLLIGAITLFCQTIACSLVEQDGACVSSRVQFQNFSSVYCYSEWSKDECRDNDQQEVNGADSWNFHSGDTCGDLGYTEGSNS